jgi:cystine transport system substrate-binding protein
VSAAGAARPGESLRREARTLDTRAHRALLDLYALDSRLHTARAQLASLEARAAALRREQATLRQQVAATRHTLASSQRELAQNLSLLYKQGDVNELAVMLGAQSLDEALTRIDDLNRVADASEQVVEVTTQARTQLAELSETLAARRASLETDVAAARQTAAALEAAWSERVAFIGRLRNAEQLKLAQVRALEATAERVVDKSSALQAAAPQQLDAPSSTASGTTLTVSATGYSLPGHTATGMPTGWGVVAVDPAVIPLGTRLTVPGYGEAVAADTGGSVRGATIDIWFPTLAQARAWGRRTITITLH